MDFAAVQAAFAPLHRQLDHHYLNDVAGLDNPTCENIAAWIWQRLQPSVPGLSALVVHETPTMRCIYRGPPP
jgi:6-pyruvoyltetrahydropterin/6-carboxytetrahydropterin synthase